MRFRIFDVTLFLEKKESRAKNTPTTKNVERSPLVASARTHIRPERAEAVAGGEFGLPAVGADDRGQGRSHV